MANTIGHLIKEECLRFEVSLYWVESVYGYQHRVFNFSYKTQRFLHHALLLQEWALHTGKYREGVDQEEFARWKTNLRCALNKAADIEEVKDESQKEAENPYRVFKFKPVKSKQT